MGMETSVHKTPSYDARISNGLSLNVYIIAIGKANPFLSNETVEIQRCKLTSKKSLVLVPD